MRLPRARPSAIGRTFINLDDELTAAVVRTIEAGWELALSRPEIKPEADEVTITECLRDAMRAALSQKGFPWCKSMIVAPGTESRSRPGMTAPDGRTDIPLYLTFIFARSGEHDPHVILECKRLAQGNTTLARNYVVEGIDRFRTGKYAENHARGFMIGYVITGTRPAVVSGINNYLAGRSRHAEVLYPSNIQGLSDGWISKHPRHTGRLHVTLYHAMLTIANANIK